MFEDRYAQIQYDSDNLENVTVKEVRDVPEGKGSLEDVVSEKLRETAEFVQEIVNREKNDTIPGNTGGMAQDWPAGDRGGTFFWKAGAFRPKCILFPRGAFFPGKPCQAGDAFLAGSGLKPGRPLSAKPFLSAGEESLSGKLRPAKALFQPGRLRPAKNAFWPGRVCQPGISSQTGG